MRADLPRVSVVIPYYDHGRHLHQTVSSALRAYSGPLEILLVNDGSIEPKAAHYIETALALSPTVRVISQGNQGLSAARNTGIRDATGDFVQLLDSDDLIVPGKLDEQVAHFAARSDLSISITNYLICDPSGTFFRRDGDPISRFDFSADDFLMRWERGFSIPIHCALFRREMLSERPFDTSLHGKEDWVFWTRLALGGARMSYLPLFGAVYRQHHASMSKSFKKMGESWLAAAALIERELPEAEAAAFRDASRKWHATFYEPRSGEETSVSPARNDKSVAPKASEEAFAAIPAAMEQAAHEAPLISVIVPVYNHYRYLRACLNSVLRQTLRQPFELIIVDDASSDARVAPMLRELAAQSEAITLIENESNLGIAAGQNRAAAKARGAFLAFLDCDDRLDPHALEAVAQHLDGADYVFTDRVDIDADDKRVRVARYGGYVNIKPSGDIRADLLDGMVASHLKLIRREAYLAAGGFDPQFGGVQDWELALKMAEGGARMRYLPKPLYFHRLHSGSVTGDNSVRQFWLSNRLRRRFAAHALRPGVSDAQAIERARAALAGEAPEGVVVHTGLQRSGIAALKAQWRNGAVCVYRASPNADVGEINLLREYNSYFDTIFAPDEATASALVGYMWDHAALYLDGEPL